MLFIIVMAVVVNFGPSRMSVGAVAQDLGRQVAGGLLRKVPLFGSVVADNVVGEDPRYSYKMTPAQIENAWKQVQMNFRECPTCRRIVCLSDFDTQTGFCKEDSPRTNEIAEAEGAQAGATIKGFAAAFGLDKVVQNVQQAAQTAQNAAAQAARCPNDGTLAAPGTKFCPECGAAMIQPASGKCLPVRSGNSWRQILPQLWRQGGSCSQGWVLSELRS